MYGKYHSMKGKKICIIPIRMEIEAIQRLKPPTTSKGYRIFAGFVHFLSLFYLELQKLLKSIYNQVMTNIDIFI